MTPEQESLRGRLAAAKRHHPDDHPTLEHLGRELKASRLADYIRRTVDSAPELTEDQRARLAALLRPGAA